MRQNIYMKDTVRRRKQVHKKSLLPFTLILFFILLPFVLWISEGRSFTSALGYVFSRKNIVRYDTYTVSFDDSVSSEYVDSIKENLNELEFNGKKRFKIKDGNADIRLSRIKSDDSKEVYSKRLIPVGHVYSLLDSVSLDSLSSYSVYVLEDTYVDFLKKEYGVSVSVLKSYSDLLGVLQKDDMSIGLLDIKDIDFSVKILEVGGGYFLDDMDACISVGFFAEIGKGVDDFILSVLSNNMDRGGVRILEENIVKVNMGGVVAISRGLGLKIDRSGDFGYPAREIGEFLADADLTHVSNEVSFVPGCTSYSGMSFCSKPEYMEVLKLSGVDIVELTGNHNNDFGSQYSRSSIELYKDEGMRYFGGGLDKEDASRVLYEEVNGTTMAFVGYNYYDTIYPSLALAGDTRSGANSYSEEKVKSDVRKAKERADVVIVTFQFQECYSYPNGDVIYPVCYKPLSNPDQKKVFRHAIDMGADIVVGTQAHQPQTYELYGDGIIFYGLGNLYFDQYMWIGTRQGLVLSHYFYMGKHIQTRVVPIYMDRDLIPRLATEEQGSLLMRLLKEAR